MGNKPQGKTSNQAGGGGPFDPLEAWRQMRDAGLDAWAKSMIDTVNTDAYAKASGAMLDACLSGSAPFREMLQKSMVQALQQLGLPTRADFESLAERMTNIEMRIDDLDAKLDLIGKPARTRAGARRSRKDRK